jgi:RNA polymerase sigma-70 factor (ECF subfamily)
MSAITPDSAETSALLEEVQAGDRDAFEKLFSRHQGYIRQVIGARLDQKLRARVDPSDIVQETHLEAVRALPDYLDRRPMPFRLWLRKTAQQRLQVARRRHAQAARRAVSREVPLPEESSLFLARGFLATGSTPSQQLERRDLTQRVRQAVSRLSESDQEVLLLAPTKGCRTTKSPASSTSSLPPPASAMAGPSCGCRSFWLRKG